MIKFGDVDTWTGSWLLASRLVVDLNVFIRKLHRLRFTFVGQSTEGIIPQQLCGMLTCRSSHEWELSPGVPGLNFRDRHSKSPPCRHQLASLPARNAQSASIISRLTTNDISIKTTDDSASRVSASTPKSQVDLQLRLSSGWLTYESTAILEGNGRARKQLSSSR